jgi:hypothetical protein
MHKDRFLNIDEAAERLHPSKDWPDRQADVLVFRYRV